MTTTGLANALSPQSALSKKMMATPVSTPAASAPEIAATPTPGSSKQAAATPASAGHMTTPHKSSFESGLPPATPASAASNRSSTSNSSAANPRPSPLVSPPAMRTTPATSSAAAATAATTLVAAESQTTPLPARPAVERRDAAVQHEAEYEAEPEAATAAMAASEAKGSSPAVAGGGGGGFGEAVEPDFERTTARPTADRPMQKSGIVKELRLTGSGLARHRVWKEVWLQVDHDVITVYKRRVRSVCPRVDG